jgi:sec-independent protein translocase protein TatC
MKLRPIGHEERLSIIDHLDELRSRLLFCGAALLVAFCFCFWQNHSLLNVLNRALPPAAKTGLGNQPRLNASLAGTMRQASIDMEQVSALLAQSKGVAPGAAAAVGRVGSDFKRLSRDYPRASQQSKPIAIGVGESFTTTIVVVAYFALMVTLPLILYQVYGFVLPALSKTERRVATPSMVGAPFLFLAGAAFTYFAILPPAIHFLQGYNSNEFQNLIQAKAYYRFEILLMMGIGLTFQVPLLALGLQKVGIISSSTLTLNWRYATVLIAVIVAALPGVDPVTMLMEMLPLAALYVASIGMLKWVEYRNLRRARVEAAAVGSSTAG